MTNERFLKMVTIEGETWKPVPGYENEYLVSSIGKILFIGRNLVNSKGFIHCIEPHLLTWRELPNGYATVDLWKNNKSKRMYVHRIVALAFIPNENNYPHIDHIDRDRLNCSVGNLRWCNPKINSSNPLTIKHKAEKKLDHDELGRWISKKVVRINLNDNSDIKLYNTVSETKKDGFNPSQVSAVCLGNRKSHNGFVFYYLSEYETLIKSKNSFITTQSDYQQEQPPQLQDPQLPLQFEP